VSRSAAGRACTVCARTGLRLRGGRCGRCRAADRTERCDGCGLVRTVSTRTAAGEPLCGTCRNRTRAAARTRELHADATRVVTGWLSDVDVAVIGAAVAAAAPNLRQAQWLIAALGEGPGVLHRSTTAPPVVDRLVERLVGGGVTGIAPPCCVRCGRRGWLSQRIGGRRACVTCAHTSRAETCTVCGKARPVTVRDAAGGAICSSCRRNDPAHWEACSRCAKQRPVVRRLDDGAALCPTCNRRVVAVCSICGHERVCAGIRAGTPRCQPCTARQAACSWCGRTARVSMVWATGPVCSTCRYKGLEAKATCAGCGQLRRPDPRHPSGRCADCVGLPVFSVCADCGGEDRIYRDGRCIACTVLVTFDALTAGTVDLSDLRDTLAASDRPRAVLRWLRTEFVADTVGKLATGDVALSHHGLDELGDNLAVTRLRSVLVQSGLLVERNEVIARLETWITEQVAGIPDPDDRRTIEAFATWQVLRRARRRAERAEPLSIKNARSQIRRAIEFLAFLQTRGHTLADCTQPDVELWLSGPQVRRHVADFLGWARRQRRCPELDVRRRSQVWPARQISDHELRALVTRLLTDLGLALADRVAGLFVVCYAQMPARIVRLRAEHVTIDTDSTKVRFGRDEVVLPEVIATLLAELVAVRRGRAATEPHATSRWLFPGAIPGRPLDAETLRLRLVTIGVANLRVRTATLLDLAAQIPATVLADLVGLHDTTAARWNRAAGGDWATYVAIKSAHTNAAAT
jgi:hypothetical protein